MKKILAVLLLLHLQTSVSYTQTIGQVVHPAPFYTDNLAWTTFTNNDTGYTITDKRILKTINGGTNWTECLTTGLGLKRILFLNRDTGFVTTSHENYILMTKNGGANWYEVFIGSFYFDYEGIFFLNASTGYIAGGGETGMDARITTNCGESWRFLTHFGGFYETFTDVFFLDSLNGFLVGELIFLKTTNGGANWTTIPEGNSEYFNRIFFTSPNVGYAFSSTGMLFTTDAGYTWTRRTVPNASPPINFGVNQTNLLIAGDEDFHIFRSLNYGNTWSMVCNMENNGSGVSNIYFKNNSTGFAIGWNGLMMKTTDYGQSWFKTVDLLHNINSIKVKRNLKIASIGENGLIFLSEDFGNNWKKINLNLGSQFSSIATDTAQEIFIAAGENGNILKSDTSGLYWDLFKLNTDENLFKIINSNPFLFIMGDSSTVFCSSDNGSTWINIFPKDFSDLKFRGICAIKNYFYLVGDSGTVLRSNDFGKSWVKISFPEKIQLNEIFFNDQNTGYLAGVPKIIGIINPLKIKFFKTTDAGSTWDSVIMRTPTDKIDFKKIIFVNESTGYMFSNSESGSYIFQTTNNGNTWGEKFFGRIKDIDFVNKDTAFIIGNWGEIFRSTNIGSWQFIFTGINLISNSIPVDFILNSYPNPFNPSTKIVFSIPKSEQISLKLFDLTGKEISTLTEQYARAGSYEIEFNANGYSLASGIYFLTLVSESNSLTRKIVLLK